MPQPGRALCPRCVRLARARYRCNAVVRRRHIAAASPGESSSRDCRAHDPLSAAVPGLHELFERFGVLIVFINALLHELAVPIPLTPTVLVAGAASSEALAFFCLVMAVVAGTVIGNAVWFAAGRRFGASVLGFLCRFSLSPDTCVAKSADGFGRWGAAFFFIGRFLPGISLVAPPVAGALGMSWRKFLVLTALSAMVWATVVILLGAALQRAVLAALAALGAVPAG